MNVDPFRTAYTISPFYLYSVFFSLFVSIVRPGEFITAFSNAKLVPLSMILTCLAFLSFGGLQSFRKKTYNGLKPTFFLLFLGSVSIFFSVWPGQSFKTWWSVLLINTLLLLFWLPVGTHPARLRSMVALLACTAGTLALVLLFLDPAVLDSGRLQIEGSTYDPNDLAFILASLFPFVVFLFLTAGMKGRLLWGALLVCLLLGLFKTGSRGGILALVVAGILLVLLPSRRGIRGWFKCVFVLLVVAFFLSPVTETVKERWREVLSGEDYNFSQADESGAGRLDRWRSGAKLFLANPVTGVGLGNSGTALGLETKNWLTIHNSYLQVGMELGVAGLLLFFSLLWTIWRNCTLAIEVLDKRKVEGPLILLAAATRIALVAYMMGAFFLSQAYSILVPVLLILSNGVYHAAESTEQEQGHAYE